MATKAQKRQRLDALTADLQGLVDQVVGTELPDVAAQIDALVAVSNRSAAQNVDLRSLRRDRLLMRMAVKAVRLALLLDGSRARDADITGTDA